VRLVATSNDLAELLSVFAGAPRLAFDLEANGRFAYRARVCLVQLAWAGTETAIVDALEVDLAPLKAVLGPGGPVKIVHDVAFDARMLAEIGIELGNVHDTALTAQLLGRPATGLASLALSELGVTLDKSLQSHDWKRRPLSPEMLAYLETDVLHLAALDDRLWELASGAPVGEDPTPTPDIRPAILEETRYRIAQAVLGAAGADAGPAYARIKGVDRLGPLELAVARRLDQARDLEAQHLDVPPHELVGNAALLDLAKAMPRDMDALKRVPGAMPRYRGYAVARELLRAVAEGIADGGVPPEDRPWLERQKLPQEVIKARKARHTGLSRWRKKTALERHVHEQVVLPGHCLSDLAELDVVDLEHVAGVPGIGAFRVERDGAELVEVLALTQVPKAVEG
jgi:ribonuclease D